MSSDHRYRLLKVPSDAPFELRPSPGKGWGAFATRPIKRGILIMIEDPLVVMHKSANEITKTSRGPFEFKNLLELFNEKAFPYHNLGLKGSPAWGLFALHSRFNHSCLPNCVVPTNDDQHIMSFATKDIALGEEITFCYSPHFKGSTRRERQTELITQLGFTCNCEAWRLPSGPLGQLSDMRRRLIRGLDYLITGVDLQARMNGTIPGSPLITEEELRLAGETDTIPPTSKFVYHILNFVLLEEEGLLDDLIVGVYGRELERLVKMFKTQSNIRAARATMAQGTWKERLRVACQLWGRKDAIDDSLHRLREARIALRGLPA